MKIEQKHWTADNGWKHLSSEETLEDVNLVLGFGSRPELVDATRYEELHKFYPNAHILLGSTSGEIVGEQVVDHSIISTAISFDSTKIRIAHTDMAAESSSIEAGKTLAKTLTDDDLSLVFVISDGQQVNGSELVAGFNEVLPANVPITGGLAGDGADFRSTLVGIDSPPAEGQIVAVGFYGDRLRVGHGSKGGWDPFGPERIITKSDHNVLYELDGKSALDLYKEYLGEKADGLPGTALLFPLSIKNHREELPVVRTILSVDEENKSMTFAGDLPEGARARLMKANFDRLVDGAISAAGDSLEQLDAFTPEVAILISCVGRKLILGQRVEEEVEGVHEIFGNDTVISGFYSYGEISPLQPEAKCALHNQTMTITTLAER